MHVESTEMMVDVIDMTIPAVQRGQQTFEPSLTLADFGTRPNVVAVIPAHNEERFIGSVVLKAAQFARTVIVVDDGSSDATTIIARAAGALVLRHQENYGKGAALNTGFRAARDLQPEVVVTLDADGQHVPEEIDLVIAPVLAGESDIVVGSRYLDLTSEVPQHRIWGHAFFNAVTRSVSGVRTSDSQSGFRAFSPRALTCLIFNSDRFSVESEMQLLARDHRLRLSEVSITIHYHDKPKRSVWMQGLSVLHGIMKLTGQYRPLLFFGLPGLTMLVIGLATGLWVVDIYRTTHTLPIGMTILSGMLTTVATITLYTGVILHSVRGLLLNLVRPRE